MTLNGLRALTLVLALLPAVAPARETGGDFGATLVVTDRLEGPALHAAKSALRGQVVWAVILFSHCKAGAHGRCNAVADFTVLRPDGSVYASNEGTEVWRAMPPRRKTPQLSTARLGLHIRPTDPLGRYRIRAVVKDLEAKRTVTLESALVVGENKAPASTASGR
jgi:hypothetical protein